MSETEYALSLVTIVIGWLVVGIVLARWMER